jgi:ribosome-associated protein
MREDLVITNHVVIPSSELHFRFSRSSGPGGQNVNKLSTKVALLFNVAESRALDDRTKALVIATLGSHIDGTGMLSVTAQESRSQFQNKRIAVEKFIRLLARGMVVATPRKKTKPSLGSTRKRLESKTKRGTLKRSRTHRIETERHPMISRSSRDTNLQPSSVPTALCEEI